MFLVASPTAVGATMSCAPNTIYQKTCDGNETKLALNKPPFSKQTAIHITHPALIDDGITRKYKHGEGKVAIDLVLLLQSSPICNGRTRTKLHHERHVITISRWMHIDDDDGHD
mmetsp:Transcript_23358/g.50578  ORF Transcript_23358/g.50578 Transcript_23358/m.50578 type:complete len:114 (+) Transcript_23358:211-552(+)